MKVRELIELLLEQDPNKDVLVLYEDYDAYREVGLEAATIYRGKDPLGGPGRCWRGHADDTLKTQVSKEVVVL
jgi:hypothetical protein